MLTKAIVQSVDYTKNQCRVRIPLFENASRNVNIIEADAQFSIVPGIYNSYIPGDIVFIGFEENKMEKPIILGKLFVSASAEYNACRGSVSGNSLVITDTAQLPYSTIFNYGTTTNNALYKELNTPKKLADGIINLQRKQDQTQKYQTVIKINTSDNVKYDLYLKTSDSFTYSLGDSEEPLNRLCTVLSNSQTDNIVIPLDFALESIEVVSETLNDEGVYETACTTEYTTHQALVRVQDSTALMLEVVIDGVKHIINKDKINKIQSISIKY